MNPTNWLLAIAAPLIVAASVRLGRAAPSYSGTRCISSADSGGRRFYEYVRAVASIDEGKSQRAQWGIPYVPADSVTQVSESAKCAAVGIAINRHLDLPDSSSHAVVLVRMPSVYFALEPDTARSEFKNAFILDAKLSRVVKQIGY